MTGRPALRVIEGGAGRVRIAPAAELAALGVGLVLVCTWMARLPSWLHQLGTFQTLFVFAFAFYGLALLRLRRYAAIPRVGLAVFGVAFAMRMALLPVTPTLSGDLYRYVWEGRVVTHGGDPYRQSPLDPGLEPMRDAVIHPRINHPELSTIYPPLAIAGFALVASVSPTVIAFKLWVIAHDLALVLLLLLWARRRGAGEAAVLAYAWNPLMVVEVAGSGHNDPTAMVWLALAFLLVASRPTLSALALAAGALVKLAPLVALPFLLRRWPWRARVICLAVLAVGLRWFWNETRATYSGLVVYWGSWRNNELLFHYLEDWTGSFVVARTITLALIAGVVAWAWWKRWDAVNATRLGLRAGILISPVLHPWYLGWALMFEPLGPSAPWLLLSLTAILNYGVFMPSPDGAGYHLPLGWRWVEYGIPVIVAVVGTIVSSRRRHHTVGGA